MHKFCNILTVFEPFSLGLNFLFVKPSPYPFMSIEFFVTFSVYFITFAYCFYSYIYLTNQKNVEQPAKSVTFCTTVKNSADIGVFHSDISRVFYIFSTYSSISSCWLRCPHLLLRQCLHLKCQHLKQQMSQYLICQPLPLHPKGLQVRSHHMNLMCR